MLSRTVVKAQRDDFLCKNTWDATGERGTARNPVPVSLSTLTRAKERADTIAFMRKHPWDEDVAAWVALPARRMN